MTDSNDTKSATPFKDLPLAPRGTIWSAQAAKKRVRVWAGADEGLTTPAIQKKYRDCFFWYDASSPQLFSSYKLPFSDILNGKLTAVARGIFAAAAAMLGARGGVDIPAADRPAVIRHIERYYKKLGQDTPFTKRLGSSSDDEPVTWQQIAEAIEQLTNCGDEIQNNMPFGKI